MYLSMLKSGVTHSSPAVSSLPLLYTPLPFCSAPSREKHLQNLSVSSAAALTTVCWSGLRATWRILSSWPCNSPTCVSPSFSSLVEEELSSFQMFSLLQGFPWEERSSRWCWHQMRPLTWEAVFLSHFSSPLQAFQIQMDLSADPPPVARRLGCHGHQASAYRRKGKSSVLRPENTKSIMQIMQNSMYTIHIMTLYQFAK